MDNPIVSIVIPVFNNAELVKIMVDSVVAQEYKNWELLLVDDGSDEPTIAVLQRFLEEDSRIQLISRNRLPKGAQTCRNIGMDAAKGKYIVFFDSDDYVASCCLSQRVAYMETDPGLDFSVFPAKVFRKADRSDAKLRYGVKPKCGDDLFLFLIPYLPFVVWNNIYRLDSLRRKGIRWDEKLKSLQDSDFNMESILSGLNYEYASIGNVEPDYYYRLDAGSGSISRKIVDNSHFESHLYFYQKTINSVRIKFGKKYDNVLRNRAIFFFLRMQSLERNNEYLERLSKLVKINFVSSRLFSLQCQIYFFIRSFLSTRLSKYIAFPVWIKYHFRYCQ